MTTTLEPKWIADTDASEVRDLLQRRLVSLLDMSLVLKHAHWNVVGPGFIAVHELFDEQVARIHDMADEAAERIATLGGVPDGRARTVVDMRTWATTNLGVQPSKTTSPHWIVPMTASSRITARRSSRSMTWTWSPLTFSPSKQVPSNSCSGSSGHISRVLPG